MCGICGFNWQDENLVRQMADCIAHRGPDADGVYTDPGVSLGHRRLSIIDLSEKGNQPMANSDKTVQIIYNGEVFNYKEIREDLEKKGYEFKNKTDTEVIIYAYMEYGLDFLEKLNGMFAFCIYDSKKKVILLARDRIGIKPLYYYSQGGKLIFASEIKAILEHKIKPKLNKKALIDYMTFQNILDDSTFFEGVKMLLPGKYLLFDLKKKTHKVETYWDVEFSEHATAPKQAVEDFNDIFEKAVERHMISDVPVGSYLSGGFDSGAVTAEACISTRKKDKNFRINTYTAKFKEGEKYDETPCSRALVKKYNAKSHEVTFSPHDMMRDLKKVVYHLDEPKVGMPIISAYYVAKQAAKDVTVVLTGHGGDEFFAGYPVYKAFYLKSAASKNPFSALGALTYFKASELPRSMYYLLFPLLQKETSHGLFIMFSKSQRKKLFTKEFQSKGYDPVKKTEAYYRKDEDSLKRLQRLYIKTYLPGMLVVEDKVSMAHSIESRIPFCDNEMIDFSLKTPYKVKLARKELKFIVKEAMKGKLPKIYYDQPKKGFPTPMSLWLRNEMKEYAEDILLGERAKKRGIFNQKYVRKLLDRHFRSRSDGLYDLVNTARIWSLINIELWHRLFIDGEAKEFRAAISR